MGLGINRNGKNQLGRLWMKLRDEYKNKNWLRSTIFTSSFEIWYNINRVMIVKKLRVINKNGYLYKLEDINKRIYKLNIEFINADVNEDDYILLPEKILEEKNIYTYGPIIAKDDINEYIVITNNGNETYLQRYYG